MTVISLKKIFFFDFQYICGIHLRSVYVGIFIHARQNRNCVQQKDTRKRHRRGDVSILCNYYVSPGSARLCGAISSFVFKLNHFQNLATLVMLHETIRNDDFLRDTALQHCRDIVSNGYNIVTALQPCGALKIVFANRPG